MKDMLELAEEFEADAEMLERVAQSYLAGGMREQYEILWHEGAVYRCCALRVRAITPDAEAARLRGVVEQWPNLQMVSRWLKERREASLKGGISLQASWEEGLRTILRAHQEIDAYVELAAAALQEE